MFNLNEQLSKTIIITYYKHLLLKLKKKLNFLRKVWKISNFVNTIICF